VEIDDGEEEGIEDICNLPKKIGICRAAFPRFFFNAESGKCEKFTYGGCGANANNFETLDECLNACPRKNADVGI